MAKVVVLGEGPRGTLAKTAIARLGLDRARDPQVYAVGVKEIWQCPAGTVQPGSVIHTMGAPLPNETFGGGFIYGMKDDVERCMEAGFKAHLLKPYPVDTLLKSIADALDGKPVAPVGN